MPAIAYTLLVNGAPPDPEVFGAIQQIEVEDSAEMAGMMRLRLATGVREDRTGWTILDDEVFERLANLRILITVGAGVPEPLIDAYVIEASVNISNEPGKSSLNIVAMDPTVMMNLEEKVRPWPDMADSDIATAIFREYHFIPEVERTQPSRLARDRTVIQRGTDIHFLKQLAARNGYECYVEAHPTLEKNVGYFRSPQLGARPQGVLFVNMADATNVNSFSARFDMLSAATAHTAGVDIETRSPQKADVDDSSLESLGAEPTLSEESPRTVLLSESGLSQTDELTTFAQAVVDRSTWAVTADGELNTVAYGGVLRARRIVLVRGAGLVFSGRYYVERVLHTFGGEGYTQRFTLRRNASGLAPEDLASPD